MDKKNLIFNLEKCRSLLQEERKKNERLENLNEEMKEELKGALK